MTTLRDVQSTIESLYPTRGAESWDSVGTASGDPDAPVERILFAVDPVAATVDEALGWGAQLLFTHHPLLLRGVTSIAEDRYKGALLARLIRGGCALHSAHTNADVVETGPTGTIFDLLGVPQGAEHRIPFEPLADQPERGIGLVGELPEAVTLREFADRVAELFPATAGGVRVAGDPDMLVQRVACCSGAGDSFLSHPLVTGADVYLTSDLRHHPASEAREQARLNGGKPALVDTAHFASEFLWLEGAAMRVREAHPEIDVRVSTQNTDPWSWQIEQPR
ncbi:Nif3-like dinuclear metal center hexameric protein [Gulosibacter molinativorax]|uniref:GTP cyclohydrolase 1 type 2 homolog n=1 Tax=Gulosibacter molinativorax TaxID=256821 RepID=A0ABT7C6K7_9MICO|nr:Nif3-like dinuclear metal center hexameric protein [Gulosibacter molinativorax]MDJ1370306.1 Nif3-like dinuclear metal center hexameric protein [Gulosibacter molinativorax]QUY61726.1 GTP cyclohydrolase 1 type 2 homolog [Gulosibacter molinativorax]